MESISVERPACAKCHERVYGVVAARTGNNEPICGNCIAAWDASMVKRTEEVRRVGCLTCGGTGIQTAHALGVKAQGVCLACVDV